MPRSRRRRILTRLSLAALAVIVGAVLAFLAWTQIGVMAAEPRSLDTVHHNDRIQIDDSASALVLTPAEKQSDTGLVFIPGAKVDAAAYAANLAPLVAEHDITIVIARPWLNLALFDLRPLSSFTDLAPHVETWLVGGHSLGGVRSCSLAKNADALVLFASYCATDLSNSGLSVLSISGSEDGLTTAAKIEDAADLLPAGSGFIEIPGANHADFGDYGPQAGDRESRIDDAEMTERVVSLIADFTATLP